MEGYKYKPPPNKGGDKRVDTKGSDEVSSDSDEADMVESTVTKFEKDKFTAKQIIKKFLFYYWDGISFFGFGDYKLRRMRGVAPGWFDKFTHPKNLIMYLVNTSIMCWILYTQIGKLGTQKS